MGTAQIPLGALWRLRLLERHVPAGTPVMTERALELREAAGLPLFPFPERRLLAERIRLWGIGAVLLDGDSRSKADPSELEALGGRLVLEEGEAKLFLLSPIPPALPDGAGPR